MTRIGFIADMRRTRQGTFTRPASSSGFKISINFTFFDCEVWRRDESSGEVKWQKHDYWPAYGLLRRSSVSNGQELCELCLLCSHFYHLVSLVKSKETLKAVT